MNGRAYAWFQNLPSYARRSMTINGEPVVEIDYSAMHCTILYNTVGIKFADDPYEVDGFPRDPPVS
jgi:hypothetical protein